MTSFERAGALLTIDLDALRANYRLLRGRAAPAAVAAVVKADGYGLGAAEVARALADEGCKSFFVATLDEALALRQVLSEPTVYVLDGPPPGSAGEFRRHRLMAVINSLGQLDAIAGGDRPEVALHLDTGMARLGVCAAELARLLAAPERLDGVRPTVVMSHLACAEIADSDCNRHQRDRFNAARAGLAAVLDGPLPASLANSSGIFLGADYHFQLVRPGAALYGVNPTPGQPSPMAQVVHLKARILQVRDVDTPMTVGYGAAHRVTRKGRIATVGVGYADGLPRSLGNRACGYLGGKCVPLVGRVSMDLMTFDVSELDPSEAQAGVAIELIGSHLSLDRVAAGAGTIGYELLTRLSRRLPRAYVGGVA